MLRVDCSYFVGSGQLSLFGYLLQSLYMSAPIADTHIVCRMGKMSLFIEDPLKRVPGTIVVRGFSITFRKQLQLSILIERRVLQDSNFEPVETSTASFSGWHSSVCRPIVWSILAQQHHPHPNLFSKLAESRIGSQLKEDPKLDRSVACSCKLPLLLVSNDWT